MSDILIHLFMLLSCELNMQYCENYGYRIQFTKKMNNNKIILSIHYWILCFLLFALIIRIISCSLRCYHDVWIPNENNTKRVTPTHTQTQQCTIQFNVFLILFLIFFMFLYQNKIKFANHDFGFSKSLIIIWRYFRCLN